MRLQQLPAFWRELFFFLHFIKLFYMALKTQANQ